MKYTRTSRISGEVEEIPAAEFYWWRIKWDVPHEPLSKVRGFFAEWSKPGFSFLTPCYVYKIVENIEDARKL